MNFIDPLLNKITMYKLVAIGLGTIVFISILLASLGFLAFDPLLMLLSLGLLLVSAYGTEFIFSKLWRRPLNTESAVITTFIIFLIFPAPKNNTEILATLLVGILASASKYLIAWKGKHVFNPAAFGVVVVGLLQLQVTTWWIGNGVMWPITLIFGLLVVRKIRKFSLVFAFVITALVAQIITLLMDGSLSVDVIQSILISSPLIFLSTIMLTEPATMPPRRYQQVIFGIIIGFLFAEAWHVGPVTIIPAIALLLGNIYAFIVSPKLRVELKLKEIQKISDHVSNYVFQPSEKIHFIAGQYMEWTLGHVKFDFRGNRRSFTVASSPTEDTIQLGVKFYTPSSAFKYTLSNLKPGDTIYVSQLAGNFILNGNETKKLVFIAGGIGITPFRSMIKYITDTKTQVDLTLLYVVGDASELAYLEEFKQAEPYGVKLIKVVHEQLNKDLITKLIPDYSDRFFYISGPNAMVDATRSHLSSLGVPRTRIKKDHFSGY
jgi:ferredoxin-NADP reductase/Na+-translocating ferredoxin:NAD+ oxidoreductase RnfD subunit